jgi:hypothetical protein
MNAALKARAVELMSEIDTIRTQLHIANDQRYYWLDRNKAEYAYWTNRTLLLTYELRLHQIRMREVVDADTKEHYGPKDDDRRDRDYREEL